jgi:hypothetical protein
MNPIVRMRPTCRAVVGAVLLTAAMQSLQAANYTSPTTGAQQPGGNNWDTLNYWQPGGLSATDIVANDPAATFQLRPGARLRSPVDSLDSTFPGAVLTLEGNGVRFQNPAATDPVSEIRFKQSTAPEGGIVTFQRLVLNGGQLDTGNPGLVILRGQLDILKTAAFNNDGNEDRGFRIESFMTGSADAQVYMYNDAFHPTFIRGVNIAGSTNTFSGKWNVVKGLLLGTGANSLGTNSITVGADGALETTYNINSPNATLQLNGRMYLHQDDVFGSVTVGTTALAKGTHTFEELNAQFPNNFPATWTAKLDAVDINGTPFDFGSGSITVVNDNTTPVAITTALPATTQVQAGAPGKFTIAVSGPVTAATWYSNNVVVATGVDLTYTTPVLDATANNAVYSVIVENTVNKATNSTTIQIITGPLNITFPGSIQQAIPQDWDTPGHWSDGNPASVSAAANPSNTYEILPGARMRSPDGSTNAVFPGSVLKVDGNSVWNLAPAVNGPLAEIRFKQGNAVDEFGTPSGYGFVTFTNLILNGGQLDVGNDGTVVLLGRVDVAKKSSLSVNAAGNRGYRIDAQLTGTNEIEVHLSSTATFDPAQAHNVNVTGTSNTFSGTWNIVTGTLLGTAPGALGTNTINIGVNGALLTTYDINNPRGSLNLQGKMFLTQNDTFRTVTVGGTPLPAGTYTYDDLYAQFGDAYFPFGWTAMIGAEDVVAPSGSITVLEDNFVPTIAITGPVGAGAYVNQPAYFDIAPTNITVTADVTIERGTITKVEFFEGATKIGEDTTAPYSVTWNNVPVGAHTITAKVSAANGQSATAQLRIVVGAPFVSVNFQNAVAETPQGYLPDFGDVYGDRGNGQTYGWDADNTVHARFRAGAAPDIRYATMTHMQKTDPLPAGRVWEIAVPNGTYIVTGSAGDADNFDSVFDIQAEGVTFILGTPTTAERFVDGRATVTVTDGKLTISNGPTAVNNKIDFLDIFQTASQPTPTSPTMKNLAISGGAITFAFTSEAGVNYRVQYKDSLDDATWQTLETKAGTGSDINVSYPLTPTMRFFRVITP